MVKKMLLHSCCGPCSTSVIETLKEEYDITIFYYNPNIYPENEYLLRKSEQKRYLSLIGSDIQVVDCDYDYNKFLDVVKGFEKEKEGGSRCEKCFYLRLDETAKYAKENNYDIFTTTLSVSPYKNAKLLNQIGLELQEKYHIEYLISDFKKKNGYLRSIQISKQFDIYRQHYCGCEFSINTTE